MSIRETSREALRIILANGLLSKRRTEIYEALVEYGPCTGNELFRRIPASKRINANVVTRLGELRDMGIVKEVGTRICEVTGKRVLVWETTGVVPSSPHVKKVPERARLRNEVEALTFELARERKENEELRAQLAQYRMGQAV